jgi:hypothetical protein
MPSQTSPSTSLKPPARQTRYWQGQLVGAMFLLLLNLGCAKEREPNVELKIQVEPSSRSGVYRVSGNTNIPDQSLITVAAIRTLSASESAATNTTYSILARQIVKVEQGTWQTTLNLWQVAPDGQFQEAWQGKQSQLGALKPDETVTFVALLDPASQPPALKQNIEASGRELQGRFIRFTNDGQWYLQASEVLPIALPTGKTTPPIIQTQDFNGGRGDRFVVKRDSKTTQGVNPPLTTMSQTTAPLSPAEFMR